MFNRLFEVSIRVCPNHNREVRRDLCGGVTDLDAIGVSLAIDKHACDLPGIRGPAESDCYAGYCDGKSWLGGLAIPSQGISGGCPKVASVTVNGKDGYVNSSS